MVKIICTENGDNNRTAVALSGGMDLVVSQIGYAIKTIYTNVREQDKNAAEEFRVKLIPARLQAKARRRGARSRARTQRSMQHSSARARS